MLLTTKVFKPYLLSLSLHPKQLLRDLRSRTFGSNVCSLATHFSQQWRRWRWAGYLTGNTSHRDSRLDEKWRDSHQAVITFASITCLARSLNPCYTGKSASMARRPILSSSIDMKLNLTCIYKICHREGKTNVLWTKSASPFVQIMCWQGFVKLVTFKR